MNKKPYNQIEEQMKAATQGWEPAFDEQAWQQMEQLLEKDDDRKRPFAWWLLLIPILAGIATAGYFTLYKNDSGKNTTAVVEAKPSADANAKNNIVKVEQAVTGPQENTSMPATNGDDKHLLKSYKNPSTVAIVINAGRQYTDEPTGNFGAGNKKELQEANQT